VAGGACEHRGAKANTMRQLRSTGKHGDARITRAAAELLPEKKTRASGAHRALPSARTSVPQRRSEGGARGRTNRRMAHARGRNSRGGARAPMATAALYARGARVRERERES
jgi:hypothetical protein